MPHIPFLFVSSGFCRLASLLPSVVVSQSRLSAWFAPNHLATCLCFGHDLAHKGLSPSGLYFETIWSLRTLNIYLPFEAHTRGICHFRLSILIIYNLTIKFASLMSDGEGETSYIPLSVR